MWNLTLCGRIPGCWKVVKEATGQWWSGRHRGNRSDALSKGQTVVLEDFVCEVVKLARCLSEKHHQEAGPGSAAAHQLSHSQKAMM